MYIICENYLIVKLDVLAKTILVGKVFVSNFLIYDSRPISTEFGERGLWVEPTHRVNRSSKQILI